VDNLFCNEPPFHPISQSKCFGDNSFSAFVIQTYSLLASKRAVLFSGWGALPVSNIHVLLALLLLKPGGLLAHCVVAGPQFPYTCGAGLELVVQITCYQYQVAASLPKESLNKILATSTHRM